MSGGYGELEVFDVEQQLGVGVRGAVWPDAALFEGQGDLEFEEALDHGEGFLVDGDEFFGLDGVDEVDQLCVFRAFVEQVRVAVCVGLLFGRELLDPLVEPLNVLLAVHAALADDGDDFADQQVGLGELLVFELFATLLQALLDDGPDALVLSPVALVFHKPSRISKFYSLSKMSMKRRVMTEKAEL